ncbi:hypothetical protein QJS66_01920 [Kocuria rhizophila]|nr:hypothetical protein QJS66_01920 [Kocuria rhizophila]
MGGGGCHRVTRCGAAGRGSSGAGRRAPGRLEREGGADRRCGWAVVLRCGGAGGEGTARGEVVGSRNQALPPPTVQA